MRRRLFNILSAVSLVLCAGTCVIWARSYHADQALTYSSARIGFRWALHSAIGQIALTWSHEPQPFMDFGFGLHVHSHGFNSNPAPRFDDLFPALERRGQGGFLLARGIEEHAAYDYKNVSAVDGVPLSYMAVEYKTAIAPLWSVSACLTLFPLWKTAKLLQSKRRRDAGRCSRCGYDLRATPDRCPECGAVSPAKVTA